MVRPVAARASIHSWRSGSTWRAAKDSGGVQASDWRVFSLGSSAVISGMSVGVAIAESDTMTSILETPMNCVAGEAGKSYCCNTLGKRAKAAMYR